MDTQKIWSNFARAITEMSEKERMIIVKRYGLYDGATKTLDELGKEFGVTRERIRQIEAKAIEKMRQAII